MMDHVGCRYIFGAMVHVSCRYIFGVMNSVGRRYICCVMGRVRYRYIHCAIRCIRVGVDLPDHELRLVVHAQEHAAEIFADEPEKEHDDAEKKQMAHITDGQPMAMAGLRACG